MTLLTVEQAAAKLKKTPRTIRRWIEKEHKLKATHPTHGHTTKYLIPEEEVTRLIAELAKEQPEQKQGPGPAIASEDITKRLERAEHWLGDLQRWFSELEARLEALEQGVSIAAAHQDGEASPRPLQKHTEAKRTKGRPLGSVTQAETPKELSSGSIILKDFAEKYGVRPMTFRDHIKIGRYGEKVAAEKIFKRETAKGPEYEYWLTPEQQLAALDFWKRHNVPFTLPHDQDQEETTL